ncbi:coenzyme F420-0:L-glutamate ligase [Actinoplanes sp. G11-F43]|uniref:coenzyme F420-0:L-glutamate ligase n=1 Tax=Actinoplanes sp. G11-F43 TaxID=3424130 RepID=UPI003D33AD1E
MTLEIRPVHGIGDVTAGDDLAELITRAAPWLADGDVLVVTSKIVSKAEGRLVEVPADGPEREEARQRVLADETARVVARRGPTTIVQTHHGFVMAAAGIDASNVDKTHLVLLPADPDASARALRAGLAARGLTVAVIISDTMGRAWRNGLTDVALGAAGIGALLDHRGQVDPYGNELSLTQMAVVDELSAAAELVKGKTGRVPVAVVRGYRHDGGDGDGPGVSVLIRDAESDMFGLGTAEAHAAGLRSAAGLADTMALTPTDPAVVRAATADHPGAVVTAGTVRLTPATAAPADLIRLGADAHRLRAALAAEGVPTTIAIDDSGATLTFGGPA